MSKIIQDPTAILDYTIDCAKALGPGVAGNFELIIDDPSILGDGQRAKMNDATSITFWLLNLQLNKKYKLTLRLTSDELPSRTFDDFVIRILCRYDR